MADTNIYQYGQLLKVAPTCGIDIDPGEIQIVGIMHPDHLPEYIDLRSWLTGDPEFDFDLQTQPWYFFEFTNGFEEGTTFDLPQFALEEVIEKANKIIKMGSGK